MKKKPVSYKHAKKKPSSDQSSQRSRQGGKKKNPSNIRINRRNMTRQMRNRSPVAPPPIIARPSPPPLPHRRVLQLDKPRHSRQAAAALPPRATVPQLHVFVLAPAGAFRHSRVIRIWSREFFPASGGGAGSAGGSEFAAAGIIVVVVVVRELAGDFGGKVAEEVGHGDEAGADDARGDFGDAVFPSAIKVRRVSLPKKKMRCVCM